MSRLFFLLLALAGCGDSPPANTRPPADLPLQSAIGYLKSTQTEHGAWHSEIYGQFRGGAANTALIIYALSHLPPSDRAPIQANIDRAVTFLLTNFNEQGFHQYPNGSMSEYPTYTTALLLAAMHRMGMTAGNTAQMQRMVAYLKESQQTTRQGWTKNDPEFGGWNQTGGDPPDATIPGKTNIAITSIVLEALQAAGDADPELRANAINYVTRCQNSDGGFFFTPPPSHFLNKAGSFKEGEATFARSYGTATADGITALLAAGVPATDARIQSALAWLQRQKTTFLVPFESPATAPPLTDLDFAQGLSFYYRFALARVMRQLPGQLAVGPAMRTELAKLQGPDGSWRNANNMMREDDPLIATAMAMTTLATAINEVRR